MIFGARVSGYFGERVGEKFRAQIRREVKECIDRSRNTRKEKNDGI